MKNIFLSIDFSDHAYNAALYAAELASHTGARLILFHSYCPSVPADNEESGEELQNMERKAQKKLDELARKLRSLYAVSITRLLKPGNVVEETLYVAKRIKSDLIIIGLAETTHQHYPVLDELTTDLLDKTNLPVLLIPPKANFRFYEQAFLALGETEVTHDISDLKFLSKLFYQFREVQLITPQPVKPTPAATARKLEDTATSGHIPIATPLVDVPEEGNVANLPTLTQHMQLLVKAYASTAGLLTNFKNSSVSFSEAIPVLLLPASTL